MTIPSHIGQYRIIRKIGAGGMGMVFLGEHMLLERRAAIKTLLPTVAVNREIVERFFNEARATSAISDPGVIQIFDFGYHVDGTAYIVMELLEGESLSARIERLGRLGLGDTLRIARQIAGSLAAAHARGIVHRDLKPENIFMVCDAEAQGGERTKILDFGICKVGTRDSDGTVTQSGAMIGTPAYMSPEQCRGAGGVDHRADIYAFGCLVFYMLTGRPPYDADAPGELIAAHLQGTPVPPSSHVSDLPPAIDAVLLRCLARSPDERYQSMTELQLTFGELYAQLDGSESTVAVERPAMLLGRGFRSMYDGSGGAPPNRSSRDTPPTGQLRAQWFEPTPPRGSSPSYVGELDDDSDLDRPPRRRGVRVALACIAVTGVVIALVATSFVTYGARDQGRGDALAIPQTALPVAPGPDLPAVQAPQAFALPVEPDREGASREPTIDRALLPSSAPASSAPASSAPASSAPVGASTTTGAATAVTNVATEADHEVDRSPSSAPPLAASADPQRRSAREVPREIKKPAARPRPRQVAAMPTTPSAPSEDLYDTR